MLRAGRNWRKDEAILPGILLGSKRTVPADLFIQKANSTIDFLEIDLASSIPGPNGNLIFKSIILRFASLKIVASSLAAFDDRRQKIEFLCTF